MRLLLLFLQVPVSTVVADAGIVKRAPSVRRVMLSVGSTDDAVLARLLRRGDDRDGVGCRVVLGCVVRVDGVWISKKHK